jgi:hypothetical protein
MTGAESRQQFSHAEGFSQIVIRPGIKRGAALSLCRRSPRFFADIEKTLGTSARRDFDCSAATV